MEKLEKLDLKNDHFLKSIYRKEQNSFRNPKSEFSERAEVMVERYIL